jgi:hypothetical protein
LIFKLYPKLTYNYKSVNISYFFCSNTLSGPGHGKTPRPGPGKNFAQKNTLCARKIRYKKDEAGFFRPGFGAPGMNRGILYYKILKMCEGAAGQPRHCRRSYPNRLAMNGHF